jgi:hypothetical protein
MSISKKIVVSLSFLAIIGGISIAIISVSANGKMFDSQAIAFIQNGDLGGYKTYLINQETNRINNIDQAKFDQIRAKYEAAKPLMDLQVKYEPQLKGLAINKNESGFIALFNQYREEAKPLFDTRKELRSKENFDTKGRYRDHGARLDSMMNFTPTNEQKDQLVKNEYQRALRDIEKGRDYNLGRNFEGRGHGIIKSEMHNENISDTEIEDLKM